MVNITKYAMKGTRAYIQIRREENGYVAVSMRNISEHELTVSPDELTERFVRGDESRNTEGSGLGLAIARSFTEAQGGTMKLEAEDDLFKVTVRWKEEKMEKPPVHREPVEEADSLKSADLQPVDPQVSDLSLLIHRFRMYSPSVRSPLVCSLPVHVRRFRPHLPGGILKKMRC